MKLKISDEELVEKAWEIFRDNHAPIGAAEFYYKDNTQYWKKGYRQALNDNQSKVDKLTEIISKLKTSMVNMNGWLCRMKELKWHDKSYAPNFKKSFEKNKKTLAEVERMERS